MATAKGQLKHLKEGLAAQIDGLDTKMGLRRSATDEKTELFNVKLSAIQELILKMSRDSQERQDVLDALCIVRNISIQRTATNSA